MTLSSPTIGEDNEHGRFLWGPDVTGVTRPVAGELARLGFTEGSAKGQLGLAAHLSRWLAAAGVGTEALTGPVVEEYRAARRRRWVCDPSPRPRAGDTVPLVVLARAWWSSAAPATPAEVLLVSTRRHLLAERGVQAEVARGYLDLVRPFVAHHAAAGAAELGKGFGRPGRYGVRHRATRWRSRWRLAAGDRAARWSGVAGTRSTRRVADR